MATDLSMFEKWAITVIVAFVVGDIVSSIFLGMNNKVE
jgi:hypothetical protein